MNKIIVKISPNDLVLQDSIWVASQMLDYFFDVSQVNDFLDHLEHARDQRWIDPASFNSLFGSKVLVDTSTNTLTYIIEGHNLQSFVEYMQGTEYYNHIMNFFQSSPERGSITVTFED